MDSYLFQLIFASYLKHSSTGHVWRRNAIKDYYLIEVTSPQIRINTKKTSNNSKLTQSIHSTINYLPSIDFHTPSEYLYFLNNREHNQKCHDNLFSLVYKKEKYQRTCFYLKLVHTYRNINPKEDLNKRYDSTKPDCKFDEIECLTILLNYTELKGELKNGVVIESREPNWLELRNYVNFSNTQLRQLEGVTLLDHVVGLRSICLQLSLIMADDFGISSLNIVHDPRDLAMNDEEQLNYIHLDRFQIRDERKWENMLRPYIVVNGDNETVSFVGAYLNR